MLVVSMGIAPEIGGGFYAPSLAVILLLISCSVLLVLSMVLELVAASNALAVSVILSLIVVL